MGHKRVALLAAALVFSLSASTVLSAPGGQDDPAVSKSYVDAKFDELRSMISAGGSGTAHYSDADKNALIAEAVERVDQIYGRKAALNYAPVFVPAGSTLLGGDGAEIILRSGKAAARAPGENGVTNATAGLDLPNGAGIAPNNIIIVPKNDGRGVTALTDAWFIVRGEYKLEE